MYIDFVGVKPEMFISGLGGLIFMTPTGDEIRRQPLAEVVHWFFIFIGFWKSEAQLSRNDLIRLRAAAGEALSDLARAFNISPQRVYQIVHFKNH